MSKRYWYLSIALFFLTVAAGVGTILAVRADTSDEACLITPVTSYRDVDGDSYGDPSFATTTCPVPAGYVLNNDDCNDQNVNRNPVATETCNAVDDDCDGFVDEGLATSTYYRDLDGDTYGGSATTSISCAAPAGYASVNGDCNDFSANVKPNATEVCNDIDDDCDGTADDGLANSTYYRDADGDGYGTPNTTILDCAKPAGYATLNTDCNDAYADSNPGATEACDNRDNDCDGTVDEGCTETKTYYRDADGDGYGDPNISKSSTTVPTGYILNNSDCNDTYADTYPGATELCDGRDNDCDGQLDEGLAANTYYRDADGDTYGRSDETKTACAKPSGYVTNNTDCSDAYANTYPGATELCDSRDNDCDGTVDESCSTAKSWYRDTDGDGYGDPNNSTAAVSKPSGYVANKRDCDDTRVTVYPGATEIDDDIDNDCDGNIDETTSGTGCGTCQCQCSCSCDCDRNDDDDNDDSNGGSACNNPCNGWGWAQNSISHLTNMMRWNGDISGRQKGQIMSGHIKIDIDQKIEIKGGDKGDKGGKNKNKNKDKD